MHAASLSTLLLLVAAAAAQQQLVSRECLGCLCEAASQCNTQLNFCQGNLCGPFKLTNAFFIDSELAKEPQFSGQTVQQCGADLYCSAASIRKYMLKHQEDCNADGRFSCMDVAMIHQFGPGGCKQNRVDVQAGRAGRRFEKVFGERLGRCLSDFPA